MDNPAKALARAWMPAAAQPKIFGVADSDGIIPAEQAECVDDEMFEDTDFYQALLNEYLLGRGKEPVPIQVRQTVLQRSLVNVSDCIREVGRDIGVGNPRRSLERCSLKCTRSSSTSWPPRNLFRRRLPNSSSGISLANDQHARHSTSEHVYNPLVWQGHTMKFCAADATARVK